MALPLHYTTDEHVWHYGYLTMCGFIFLFVGSVNQRTIPWRMFSGIREEISPIILTFASILITLSVIPLTTLELLRRRNERLCSIME